MKEIQRLRDIVAKLRGPDGCPWDQVQTHHSLAKCLVEEASETLEAIDREDYDSMREELGDLLLQVVFHALLAEEHGKFDLEEVAVEINEKLIRRHPHVFGEPDERVNSAEEVLERWERIKAEEKKSRGDPADQLRIFKDLPPQLPALLYANDVYKRAEKAGLNDEGEWNEQEVEVNAKDLTEVNAGKAFFEWVGACRKAGIDPESALRRFTTLQVKNLENH